jgi:hypothetical protein
MRDKSPLALTKSGQQAEAEVKDQQPDGLQWCGRVCGKAIRGLDGGWASFAEDGTVIKSGETASLCIGSEHPSNSGLVPAIQ